MDPVLPISSDLFLRVLRPYEAATLYALVQKNRKHLRQWLPWLDSTNSSMDTRRFLESSYAGFKQGAGFNFGIRSKGELVGVIGFHGFDRVNRVTSLGYWLDEETCGQGIMRKSVAACTTYAFENQDMHRLYVRIATDNERSKRIPEALGFKHEGVQREAEWLYDRFVDLDTYSILASEWNDRKPDSGL